MTGRPTFMDGVIFSVATCFIVLAIAFTTRNAYGGEVARSIDDDWPMFMKQPSRNAVGSKNTLALTEMAQVVWKVTSKNLIDVYPDEPTHPSVFELEPNLETPFDKIGSLRLLKPFRSVTVADGMVFAVGHRVLESYNAFTGKKLWVHQFTGEYSSLGRENATAIYDNDMLYLFTGVLIAPKIFSLDASSGRLLWSREPKGDAGFPTRVGSLWTLSKGKLYYSPGRKRLTVLDVRSRKVICSYQTKEDKRFPVYVAITLYDRTVFAISEEGRALIGVDADTCRLSWKYPIAYQGVKLRVPVAAGGAIYLSQFISRDINLISIDLKTKKPRFIINDDNRFFLPPVIADGVVFVSQQASPSRSASANTTNVLAAYDEMTGKYLWKVKLGKGEITPPVVNGRMIYLAESNIVIGIDRLQHKVKWSVGLDEPIVRSLAVAYGLIFVVDSGGSLYALGSHTRITH